MKSGKIIQALTLIVLLTLGVGLMEAFAELSEMEIVPDGLTEGALFGSATSVYQDSALIGARYHNGVGAAYLYKKQGVKWNQVEVDHDNNPMTIAVPLTLTADDGQNGDEFGCAVTFNDNYLVVGAYRNDAGLNDAGAAYVFEKNGVNENWEKTQKLTPLDRAANDYFGYSLAISGERAVIGAYGKNGQAGAVYVFQKTVTGWEQKQKLTASASQGKDRFGWAVAMEGNTILVGAPAFENNTGRVYTFSWDVSDSSWKQASIIEGSEKSAGDFFGSAIDISGNNIIIGAYGHKSKAGTAIIFERKNNAWEQAVDLANPDLMPENLAPNDQFGVAVSISGGLAVVGAVRNRMQGVQTGAVFAFQLKNNSWQFLNKLTASDGMKDDSFGISVSTSERFTLVGATGRDEAGLNSGISYIFINSLITGDSGPGDVNGDGGIDLKDAILTLKILSGIEMLPDETVFPQGDINDDETIGVAEAIYVLQEVAGIRRGSISLSVKSPQLYANGENTTQIIIEGANIDGNLLHDEDVLLTASAGTFENGSDQITVTLMNGSAEAQLTAVASDVSITSTITAVAQNFTDSTDVKFLGVALTEMSATPESIIANGKDESTIRVKLENADGIAIGGETIKFSTTEGVIKTGGGVETNKVTDNDGIAVVTLVSSIDTGTAELTASYGQISRSIGVVFSPAEIGSIELTTSVNKLPADGGTSYATIKATIKDSSGNLINKTVNFSTTGGDLFLDSDKNESYTTPVSSENGVAIVYLFSSSSLGTAKVTAQAEGVSDGVNISFIPGSPAEENISVSANPGNLSVGGTSTIEILVKDQFDNPVADNELISISAEHGGLSSFTVLTVGGKASVTYTAPLSVPDDEIDTITVQTVNGSKATTNIRVIGPQIAGVEVSVSPESLSSDGKSTATVSVSLSMVGGGPVPDGVVASLTITSFSDPLVSDPENWGSLSATAITSGGVAVATLTSGPFPGTVTIRAEAGGKIAETEVTYTPGLINLTAVPNTLLGTGAGMSQITAEVFDASGSYVADGETVYFTLNDLELGAVTASGITVNGKATASFTAAPKGGSVEITATWTNSVTSADVTGSITVDIQPPPEDIVIANLGPDPNPNPGNINIKGTGGTPTSRIIFAVLDISGEPVADGYRVDMSILDGPNGGESIEPATAFTKDGQISTILRSGTKSGPVSIQATYYYNRIVSTVTSTITISSGPPVGEGFGIFAEYLNLSGDWMSNLEDKISVNVGDIYGNAVPDGTAVSFKTYNTGGWFAPSVATTENGIATATLRSPGDNTSPLNGFVSVTAEVNNSGRTTRVNAIAVAPEPYTNIIYVGTNGGGVYKSTDSGATWTNISRSSENPKAGQNWIDPYIKGGSAICIDPDDYNTVYVGTGYLGRGNIYRSLDGGLNWNGKGDGNYLEEWNGLISTNGAILNVMCDGNGSDYVWAGGEGIGAVFASDGETFQWGGLVDSGPSYNWSPTVKGIIQDIELSLTTRTETWFATYDVTGATVTEPVFDDSLSGSGADGTMTNVSATADAGPDSWTATYQGGYDGLLSGSATAEGDLVVQFTSPTTRTETWTVICKDDTNDFGEVFAVRGSKSGLHEDYDISTGDYESDNQEVQFFIYETGAFTVGDIFTFTTIRDQWEVESSNQGSPETRRAHTDVPYTSDNGKISFTINDDGRWFYGQGDQWTFDTKETGEWVVEGTVSGVQQNKAYSDIPYVSDTEAVSFEITGSAVNPYEDGDEVEFHTTESGLGYGRDVREIVKVPTTHGATARLYAATPNGLYRSINGGLTWTKTATFPGDHLTSIALHPDSNGTTDVIYVGTEDAGVHVLRTTNGGAATPTWSRTTYNTGRGGGVRGSKPAPGLNNQGNGIIDTVNVTATTQSETWTVTFNGTNWTVRGTVSGVQPDATTGTAYSSGGEVSFTITEGSIPFAADDKFTFRTIRDPGNTIKDLLVDSVNNKLYAVTYFFGAEETHAIGNVYVIDLNATNLPSGSWAEINTGLPEFDPVDDPTLFAQHVLALDDPDSPSAVFIGGEGINFYKATGGLVSPETGLEWQESKYGLTNRIMARMPILFSGICGMNIANIQENDGVYTYTVYIQDRYGNPPVEGSSFTVTLKPEEGEESVLLKVAYPDAQIYDGTYRDPSDADTDNPFIIRVAPEPDDKVEFVFTPTCQDTAPGCSGSPQEWTATF